MARAVQPHRDALLAIVVTYNDDGKVCAVRQFKMKDDPASVDAHVAAVQQRGGLPLVTYDRREQQ